MGGSERISVVSVKRSSGSIVCTGCKKIDSRCSGGHGKLSFTVDVLCVTAVIVQHKKHI